VSNLTFTGKFLERFAVNRFHEHAGANVSGQPCSLHTCTDRATFHWDSSSRSRRDLTWSRLR